MSLATKDLKFKIKPRTGKLWAHIYSKAAEAFTKDERLCLGEWQNNDKSGICASTVVALNFVPLQFFLDRELSYDTYRDGNVINYIFDLREEEDIKAAFQEYIRHEFKQSEIDSLGTHLAEHIMEFLQIHNDHFYLITSKEKEVLRYVDENTIYQLQNTFYTEDSLDPDIDEEEALLKKMQNGRARYVKDILNAAAKFALRGK